jgi:hypothetical protein
VGPLKPRGQVHHQRRQLLIGRRRRRGHPANDPRSHSQDPNRHAVRGTPEIKPCSTAQLNRPREWTRQTVHRYSTRSRHVNCTLTC